MRGLGGTKRIETLLDLQGTSNKQFVQSHAHSSIRLSVRVGFYVFNNSGWMETYVRVRDMKTTRTTVCQFISEFWPQQWPFNFIEHFSLSSHVMARFQLKSFVCRTFSYVDFISAFSCSSMHLVIALSTRFFTWTLNHRKGRSRRWRK